MRYTNVIDATAPCFFGLTAHTSETGLPLNYLATLRKTPTLALQHSLAIPPNHSGNPVMPMDGHSRIFAVLEQPIELR